MKCLMLLMLLVLASLAYVQAGKVSIKGECINCNEHPTTTTRKPSSPARGHGGKTTAKPRTPARKNSDSDEDDDDLSGWSLHQTAGGAQHIARRHKRQWGRGWSGSDQYIGGWTGNGPITTIDSRGTPDTFVRNSDCVGCNIRG
ncbi:hypothetical protein KR054_002993 [Drosophila jambulina]|nr:hypothetical protein KR054_002993 [Drosophila jambulina]